MKTQVIEGDVVDNTKTSKNRKVKSSGSDKPTFKQRKFANSYMKGKTMGNATKSAIEAGYSEASAHVQGSVLLKNPKVLSILNNHIQDAEDTIKSLMLNGDSDQIRLAASKELLDRTIGKPIQRSESVSVTISVESMLDTAD